MNPNAVIHHRGHRERSFLLSSSSVFSVVQIGVRLAQRRAKNVLRIFAFLFLTSLLQGCWNPFAAKPKAALAPAATPVEPEHGSGLPNRLILQSAVLRVRVYQLTLPLGAFSLNDKVWRQLNEDALDSQTAVLLARNGIRAAIGPQQRWPGIAKLLEGPGASFQEYLCQTDGRSTIRIITRAGIEDQTVFYVDRDLELQGRSFEKCDNAMRLSMSPLRDSPNMLIQVEPVVLLGTMRVARNGADLNTIQTTGPEEETFRNLRLAVPLKMDDFLVLCPANPKTNNSSVGTRFLADTDKLPPLETVLVFVPMEVKK